MARKVYQINEFPNSRYKFDIIDNARNGKNCVDKWQTIFEREKSKGAVGIINLGYFGLSGGGYASGCKIHGEWLCKQVYDAYGICIDKDGNAFVGTGKEDNAYSYAEAVPAFTVNGEEMNRDQTWSRNGTTTLGFKDGNLVCMLCDKDNGQSTAEQIEAMEEYGCQTILRMDGSWSSQGVLGYGKVCQPSQMRKDRNYLVIYDKEYEAPMSDKKLFLDPYGTGAEEETFAICDEIKEYLELYEGVEVMISRYRDNPTLDSSLRADQANQWGADLVFAININASSSSDTDGMTVAWTNKETSTAFKFAKLIGDKMRANGLNIEETPAVLATDPILKETSACAALALCVAKDYTTRAKRFTITKSCIQAICEKLGVTYNELPEPSDEPVVPAYEDDPYNDYPNQEDRDTFQNMKKLGIIPEDVKMGEVVRFGDLTSILAKAVDNIPEEDEDEETDIEEDTKPEIDEEYLKSLITSIMETNGITKEAMATQVSNAVTEYMTSYGLNKKIVEMTKTCFEVVIKALDQVDTDNVSNPS